MNAGRIAERPAAATGDGRGRRRRAMARVAALLAALAAAALLTAACGGGSPSAGSSGTGQVRLAQALAFAHCMRSHGAPNYPDPNSFGVFMVNPSDSSRFDAPVSTREACAHLRPHGVQAAGTPAEQAQQQRKHLAFIACMHRHGFPQLPDGWSGNIGQLISAHIDPSRRSSTPRSRSAAPGGEEDHECGHGN
jgi:hypothetical protein